MTRASAPWSTSATADQSAWCSSPPTGITWRSTPPGAIERSPEHRNAVAGDDRVPGDERKLLDHRLRDEHPVEGVPMQQGKLPGEPGMIADRWGGTRIRLPWPPRNIPNESLMLVPRASGTSRATGFASRVITISSPCSTRRRRRESCVLASCTPTWMMVLAMTRMLADQISQVIGPSPSGRTPRRLPNLHRRWRSSSPPPASPTAPA